MTLRNLEIFVAVAETGSMVKAAKLLSMTQPSVSQAIAELEKSYNINLFEREGKSIKLTQTGKKLIEYAKRTLLAAKETDDYLNYESEHPRISVGGTLTIGACFMGPIVAKLHDTIPNLVHNVHIANKETITEELLNGLVDIALVEDGTTHPDLYSEQVIKDHLVVICSKDHKFANNNAVSIDELKDEQFVVREKGSALRQKMDSLLLTNNIDPNICWISSDYDTIIDAVKNNLGVAIVSERLTRKQRIIDNLHICEIKGVDTSYNYALAYRKGRALPKSLMEFVRICQEYGTLDEIIAKSE